MGIVIVLMAGLWLVCWYGDCVDGWLVVSLAVLMVSALIKQNVQ